MLFPIFSDKKREKCEDWEENMPLYGILIPSPSFADGPPRGVGAGIAVGAKLGWADAGAKAELWEELTLILLVFL